MAWGVSLAESLLDECGQGLTGGVSPANAEGMACRVGLHLVPLVARQVIGLEHTGAESHRLLVRLHRVVDVEVDVHLLRRAVGQAGGVCCGRGEPRGSDSGMAGGL